MGPNWIDKPDVLIHTENGVLLCNEEKLICFLFLIFHNHPILLWPHIHNNVRFPKQMLSIIWLTFDWKLMQATFMGYKSFVWWIWVKAATISNSSASSSRSRKVARKKGDRLGTRTNGHQETDLLQAPIANRQQQSPHSPHSGKIM